MTTQLHNHETTLAKPIAGEDLRRGDYVAVLNEIIEIPSFLWCGDAHTLPPHEPVRMQRQSHENGLPLRIIDICLPFVFVKQPCGQQRLVDIRRCQFVRLDRRYAKRVWKGLGSNESKRPKGRQGERA